MNPREESLRGRITGYDHRRGVLFIEAYCPDWTRLAKGEGRICDIRLRDGRTISGRQRDCIQALLREIAEFSGMTDWETEDAMARKYNAEVLHEPDGEPLDLETCSVSAAAGFQKFLIRFMLDYEVPSGLNLLDYADDAGDYLYHCLRNKRCCICGRHSDLHHVDQVGMGRNREEIVHEGMRVLPLCRMHHTEAHAMGKHAFFNKYHLQSGVVLDRFLCQLYGLRTYNTKEEH